MLSHKRYPSTNNAVAADTQVQAVFEAEGLAVGCNLRDCEAMENGCFCDVATCEVAVTTAKCVSNVARV